MSKYQPGRARTDKRQVSRRARKQQARQRQVRRELVLLIALVALAIGGSALVYAALSQRNNASGSTAAVDGIPCEVEQATYHEHAHLTIWQGGIAHTPPAGVGIRPAHNCFYWLHVHNNDGIVHIEAPHRIVPTLGTFFDIWQQPLSARRVWRYTLRSGQRVRAYVNRQEYRGDLRAIKLLPHTDIAIEIGPPFHVPARYTFASGY